MKELQILTSQYKENIYIPNWINNGINIISVDDWELVSKKIPVLCASDLSHQQVRHWLNSNQPAIYVGRGYVGNHLYKRRWLHRASVNGWANTKLLKAPYSRWEVMNLPKHPWKVKEVKNVLIAPSKTTSAIWCSKTGTEWAESMIDKFPEATVKIRPKVKKQGVRYKTLWQDLDWADLVVSQSSAITAEAFWYGKKVISTEPCITWAAGEQLLEDWKNPNEPLLRDRWHEHLAWCQFTIDEWSTGEALDLIEQYVGNVINYNPEHQYNLKVFSD
jgi:hypothetical protein